MAQIRNLEAQRQALSDVESLLKKINVINDFLAEQAQYSSENYVISFLKENHTDKVNLDEHDVSLDGVSEEKEGQKKKKSKRGADRNTKIEAPFLCDNPQIIRTYVLRSKIEMVNKVHDLSREFNIFLEDDDLEILNKFKEEI